MSAKMSRSFKKNMNSLNYEIMGERMEKQENVLITEIKNKKNHNYLNIASDAKTGEILMFSVVVNGSITYGDKSLEVFNNGIIDYETGEVYFEFFNQPIAFNLKSKNNYSFDSQFNLLKDLIETEMKKSKVVA